MPTVRASLRGMPAAWGRASAFFASVRDLSSDCGGGAHLQLSQREAAAGAHAAVVFDGGAAHDRPQLVDGTGRDLRDFRYPGLSAAELAAGL